MDTNEELRRTRACRAAMAAALLNAFGSPFEIAISRKVPGTPWWPPALSSAIGISLFLLLFARRRHMPSVRFCSTVFVVNAAATWFELWMTSDYYARSNEMWMPFQANKLGALVVALLAPESLAGVLSIAGYAATAVARFYLFPVEVRDRLPIGEPHATLGFAGFALALLFYRLRRMSYEEQMAKMRAEAAAAKRISELALTLRDLANTPLQVIALTIAMIRENEPGLEPQLARISRALTRLAELNHILAREEEDARR